MENLDRSLPALVSEHVELFDGIDSAARGAHANLVLAAVHRSSDLAPLGALLSGSALARRTLTFVLSEIGSRAAETLPWIADLLEGDDAWVKHYSIVALQHSGSSEAGRLVATAIEALLEPDAVAFASLKLLSFGSLAQVRSGLPFLSGFIRDGVEQFLTMNYQASSSLARGGRVEKLLAVAVAARLSADGDRAQLRKFANSSDLDLSRFGGYVERFERIPDHLDREALYRIDDQNQR